MKKLIKDTIAALYPNQRRILQTIHIGKCGGRTVVNAIGDSPVIRREFLLVQHTHVRKPSYNAKNRYLFVVRNPVTRAISAYNWRHRLVVEHGGGRGRFPGEYEVLSKYETLENHADALYDDDGTPNEEAAREMRIVHHMREDIAFYLEDAFGVIGPDQVFAVLCQETLNRDLENFLGVSNPVHFHGNAKRTDAARLTLSDGARAKLVRFLAEDYRCLEKLNALHPIAPDAYEQLMKQ